MASSIMKKAEKELDGVLFSLSQKLRSLEDRSQRLTVQCKGLRRAPQVAAGLGKLQSLQDLRNALSQELLRVLSRRAGSEQQSSSVYAALSDMLTRAQTGFFGLLSRSMPEFQAKAQATELFISLSDGVWGELQKLRSGYEAKETISEAGRLMRDLEATQSQLQGLETALRDNLARSLADLKEKNSLLSNEIQQIEAQTHSRGYVTTTSSCSSPADMLFQDRRRLRSTEPVPPLELPVRSTFGPTPSSFEGSQRSQGKRVEELRSQVQGLRTQLAALHRNPYTEVSGEKASWLDLAETAREYVRESKEMVCGSGVPRAVQTLKALICALKGTFTQQKHSISPETSAKSTQTLPVLSEETSKSPETDQKQLEATLKSSELRSEQLLQQLESCKEDLAKQSTTLTELKAVKKEKLALERMLEAVETASKTAKKEHEKALEELVTDCQELTSELKEEKTAKRLAEAQISLLQTSITELNAANAGYLQGVIDSAREELEGSYAEVERRVGEIDQRLSQVKENIETRVAEAVQRLGEMSPVATDTLLQQERSQFELALVQNQQWAEAKMENMAKQLEGKEGKIEDLKTALEGERGKCDKLAQKLADMEVIQADSEAIERLTQEVDVLGRDLEASQDRTTLLLGEIAQLKYEKSVLEQRISGLLASDSSLRQEVERLTEALHRQISPSEALEAAQLSIIRLEAEVKRLREQGKSAEEHRDTVKTLHSSIEEKETQIAASNAHHAAELLEQRSAFEAKIQAIQAELGDYRDSARLQEDPQSAFLHYHLKITSAEPQPSINSEPSLRNSELQKSREELQRSKEELLETSKRNETLEREMDRLQSSNTKMRGDRVHLEAELSKSKSMGTLCDLLRGEVDRLKGDLKDLKEENQRLKAANEPLTGTLEDYEARIANYRAQLKDQAARCEELQADVQDLKEDSVQTKQQLAVALNEAKRGAVDSTRLAHDQVVARLALSQDREAHLAAQFKSLSDTVRQVGTELGIEEDSAAAVLREMRETLSPLRGTTPRPPLESGALFSSPGSRSTEDLQPSQPLDSEQSAGKVGETDHLKQEIAQLHQQFTRFEQEKTLEITHLREEHQKQISDKDQFIALILQSKPEDQPRPATPDFDFTPEDAVVLEEASEEGRKETLGDLRQLMELETGTVVQTAEYEDRAWDLVCTEDGDFEWVRQGEERKTSAIDQIREILQTAISPFPGVTEATIQLVRELENLRKSVSEVHQATIASLRGELQVLRAELPTRIPSPEDSSLSTIRAMFVSLIGEIPKLSAKGETLMKAVLNRFKFTSKQVALLDRARTAKNQEKSALLAQVLS